MLVLIGFFILIVSSVRMTSNKNPIRHALFVQFLVALYYLTQTSLRGAIWQSYGIVWAIIALSALVFLQLISTVSAAPNGRAADNRPLSAAVRAKRRARPEGHAGLLTHGNKW